MVTLLELLRAFVEAVILRELLPRLPSGARAVAVHWAPYGGGLIVEWSVQ